MKKIISILTEKNYLDPLGNFRSAADWRV